MKKELHGKLDMICVMGRLPDLPTSTWTAHYADAAAANANDDCMRLTAKR